MKKLLTGLVVAVVGLSSFGQGAMLDDAVSWLYNNGYTIFSNTRDYKPDNYMRRDEAAKFFVKVAEGLGKTDYVKSASECSFSDLNDGHADLKDVMVKSCRLGIFQGHEGKFMPTWALTNSQALAVMIRITSGYESETGVSYWADNYYTKAQLLGRLSLLPVLNNKEGLGTRGTVAQLVYNYMVQNGEVPSAMKTYQGDGFSLQYPKDGKIKENNYDWYSIIRIDNIAPRSDDPNDWGLRPYEFLAQIIHTTKINGSICSKEFVGTVRTYMVDNVKVYRGELSGGGESVITEGICFVLGDQEINISAGGYQSEQILSSLKFSSNN